MRSKSQTLKTFEGMRSVPTELVSTGTNVYECVRMTQRSHSSAAAMVSGSTGLLSQQGRNTSQPETHGLEQKFLQVSYTFPLGVFK